MTTTQPEVWLRGPVAGIAPLLQPIAHALLSALEEVEAIAADLPAEFLWTRPGGVASAGFHLQHIAGVLDRLFTYARGKCWMTVSVRQCARRPIRARIRRRWNSCWTACAGRLISRWSS